MKLLAVVLALGLTVANAGLMDKIKIKKAVAAAEVKIEKAVPAVKKACGNKKLAVKIDWAKWGTYKLDTSKHEATIGYVATLVVNEILNTMAEACKDADYKGVISGVKTLAITGKDNYSDMYVDFSFAKGTLTAKVNGDGYGSWKNKELFMKSW